MTRYEFFFQRASKEEDILTGFGPYETEKEARQAFEDVYGYCPGKAKSVREWKRWLT